MVVPGGPDVVVLVCTSVGGPEAAAECINAVGTPTAQTIASTTTPAALRMAPTLDPPSVCPVRRDRTGSARSHVHQITDEVPDPECYAGGHHGKGQLAERRAHPRSTREDGHRPADREHRHGAEPDREQGGNRAGDEEPGEQRYDGTDPEHDEG